MYIMISLYTLIGRKMWVKFRCVMMAMSLKLSKFIYSECVLYSRAYNVAMLGLNHIQINKKPWIKDDPIDQTHKICMSLMTIFVGLWKINSCVHLFGFCQFNNTFWNLLLYQYMRFIISDATASTVIRRRLAMLIIGKYISHLWFILLLINFHQ